MEPHRSSFYSIKNWRGSNPNGPLRELLGLPDTQGFSWSVKRGSCWRFLGFIPLLLKSIRCENSYLSFITKKTTVCIYIYIPSSFQTSRPNCGKLFQKCGSSTPTLPTNLSIWKKPPQKSAACWYPPTCGFCSCQGCGGRSSNDCFWLVVFHQPHWKNMIVKMGSSSPIFGLKIPKIFELPPPRF